MYVFFSEMPIKVFCPFFEFFLILSYMSCMCMLKINPLWVASLEDISFQSVDYFCPVQNMSLYFNMRNVYLLYDKILPTSHLIQSKIVSLSTVISFSLTYSHKTIFLLRPITAKCFIKRKLYSNFPFHSPISLVTNTHSIINNHC